MEELTGFQQMKAPIFPEQEQLKCPRCESANTKFCYYNNYNLSQPRHYCKNCRRYWTKGGTIRNIPVGGGTRKNAKRSSSSSSDDSNHPKHRPNLAPALTREPKLPDPSSPPIPQQVLPGSAVENSVSDTDQTRMYVQSLDHRGRDMVDGGGIFSSLLASTGQFGNLLNGLNTNGSGSKTVHVDDFRGSLASGSVRDPRLEENSSINEETEESYLGVHGEGRGGDGDTDCWTGGSNGWPNLAIYTPGSNFH